jgi:hypothetical protein
MLFSYIYANLARKCDALRDEVAALTSPVASDEEFPF